MFFFKQKTAYELRISDWSSDVCSSDLPVRLCGGMDRRAPHEESDDRHGSVDRRRIDASGGRSARARRDRLSLAVTPWRPDSPSANRDRRRSEEHTSELPSLMRNSYAVFCLKKKKKQK